MRHRVFLYPGVATYLVTYMVRVQRDISLPAVRGVSLLLTFDIIIEGDNTAIIFDSYNEPVQGHVLLYLVIGSEGWEIRLYHGLFMGQHQAAMGCVYCQHLYGEQNYTVNYSYRPFLYNFSLDLCWKRGKTKLVLVPVLFRGIQATLNKYWDQV